jgi:hypothetical protein
MSLVPTFIGRHECNKEVRWAMRQSSLSMLVFAVYMSILCVCFLLFPAPFVTFFGFAAPDPLWIRILGVVLGILAFYYVMAIREQAFRFYQWTFRARLVLFPAFLVFVLLDIAPPILIAFGAFETGCAVWTGLSLRRERRQTV